MGSKGSGGVAGKTEERSGLGILLAVVNIDKSYVCWESLGLRHADEVYSKVAYTQRLFIE